jgi:plastocyanin
MKAAYAIPFLVLGLFFVGISFEETNAQLVSNQAFLIEGSGFAVTDKSIKTSQIDLLMSSGNQIGSNTRIVIEDGFVTMDEIDFTVTDITGSILREGRFIRLVGTAENTIGSEVTISLFGKLIQNTDEGSIYSFSGKITQGSESNKIIYTTKISTLGGGIPTSPIPSTSSTETKDGEIIIHIAEGAADPYGFDYTAQDYIQQKTLYTPNRVSTIPGTTLTFVNDDTVSHNISSGKRDTNSRGGGGTTGISPYIPDGKINSGDIMPGKSWSVTIDDIGFIALFDKDYPYMTMDVVVFPDIDSDILRRTGSTNPLN